MTIRDWSTTAASNTTVGGVSIAEACPAANLNDGERAIMADVAAWRILLEGGLTTGGTATAQTITTGLSLASYATPLAFVAKIGGGLSSTGAATTLALDGLSAKSVKLLNGNNPAANDITAGSTHMFAYEASGDLFYLLTPAPSATSQPLNANLTALAALDSTTGVLVETGANAFARRTLTGTSNEVTVTNGDGAAGAPTLGLASTLALRGKTVQVQDNNFTIADDGDNTKLIAFQASGITTGTTRTVTMPDKSGTMAMTSDVTAGGGITTIASGSLSGASVTITGIPATYSYLVLHIAGASTNTATRHTQVQVSTNNGVSYDTTGGNYNGAEAAGGASPSFLAFTQPSLVGDTDDIGAADTETITTTIYGYQGGPRATFTSFRYPSATGSSYYVNGVYIGSTSAINALKILISGTGSFDAGTYALYGVA